MTTIIIHLGRSEAVLEGTPHVLDEDVPSEVKLRFTVDNPRDAFVQLTYEWLRVGPDGDFTDIWHRDGLWWMHDDPVPFSDVTIWMETP